MSRAYGRHESFRRSRSKIEQLREAYQDGDEANAKNDEAESPVPLELKVAKNGYSYPAKEYKNQQYV
ncbi:MAG: hypothetical protein Q7T54_01870 [Candidatus Levybacteria bacterium]|nr:hypothetical protein [Candidatus Levybacteria bacterium]